MNNYTTKNREKQSTRAKIETILEKLENVRPYDSGYTARCPAHDDRHNSLSISEKDGKILLHCFANCPTERIVDALGMTMRDLFSDDARVDKKPRNRVKAVKVREGGVKAGVTIADLAREKNIAEDFLKALGLRDIRLYGVPAVAMPYFDETGNEITTRYRIALQGDRFRWKKGSDTLLYGLERLRDARQAGWVLIVEGESDCWTAWYHGFPAVGVPGKSNWKSEWSKHLEGLKVFVWQEPDAEDFTLRVARDLPDALVIRTDIAKDLSEAHCAGLDIVDLLTRLKAEAIPAHEILQRHTSAEISRLEKEAAEVLSADDPLALVEAAIRDSGYGGDISYVVIVYLAATTRLLALRRGQMPAHLLIIGPTSAGKSYTMQTALRLLPEEAYHTIKAGSQRVLIFDDDADIQHKVVVFSEADSLPLGEDNPVASAFRNLLQDGYLHYATVIKDPRTGKYVTEKVEKPGPSVLMTTAIHELDEQHNSRSFMLAIPEDIQRIREALLAQAKVEIEGVADPDPALIAYQAYLQRLAPIDAEVPFALELAYLIGRSANATRILRDFQRLLSLIKAVTILRHRHRAKNAEGRLLATLDDYEVVFRLTNDMYSVTLTGVTDQIKAVVDAVRELRRERQDRVSYSRVAQKVGLYPAQVRRIVRQALRHGWLTNAETKQGLPADLNVGEPLPEREGLPTPQEIEELLQGGGISRDTLIAEGLLLDELLPAEDPVTPETTATPQHLPDNEVDMSTEPNSNATATPVQHPCNTHATLQPCLPDIEADMSTATLSCNTATPLQHPCNTDATLQHLPDIGDKVWLLGADDKPLNPTPWEIVDIDKDSKGEPWAHFEQRTQWGGNQWPLKLCVIVEKARRKPDDSLDLSLPLL